MQPSGGEQGEEEKGRNLRYLLRNYAGHGQQRD